MVTHDLQQGTPEWHAFRAAHFTASDAPAMLGESPYKTRNELLREKATGIAADADELTGKLFELGHKFEQLARPMAEEIVGQGLFPCVGSSGRFSASFDGLTMFDDVCWEHKMLNAQLRSIKNVSELPVHYRIQMEQQLMVSGADRCLFMATSWDEYDTLSEEPLVLWYEPDHALRQRIIDGWAQFEKDLESYQHVEDKPEAVGRAPEALPALRIEVTGMVTASNLAEFKAHAIEVFKNIKTDLQTDEDFADADKTTKWCKGIEDRLEAAKQHALSQTASIDELFRAVDAIKEEARQKRLTLEKLVKQRKDSIRVEMVEEAWKKFSDHVAALQSEIPSVQLVTAKPDFGGAIKGMKTLSSIRNALDTVLASAKIEADASAKEMREKLKWFDDTSEQYSFLFRDLPQLIAKPKEDFKLAVAARIEQHKKSQAERMEAERERIRKEVAAKLEAERMEAERERIRKEKEVAAKLEAERMEAERERIRKEKEVAAKLEAERMEAELERQEAIKQEESRPAPEQTLQQAEVEPPASKDHAADSSHMLTLEMINKRLGFVVTAEFLESLGFVAQKTGDSNTYHKDNFIQICRGIVRHIVMVSEL